MSEHKEPAKKKPSGEKKSSTHKSSGTGEKKSSTHKSSGTGEKKSSAVKSPRSEDHSAELHQLKDKLVEQQQVHEKALAKQHEEHQEQITKLTKQVEALEASNKELAQQASQKKSSSSSSDDEDLKAELEQAQDEVQSLQSQVAELKGSVSSLAEQKNHATAGRDAAEAKKNKAEHEVAELRGQLAKEHEASEGLKAENQKLQSQLEEAQKARANGGLPRAASQKEPGPTPAWKLKQMEKEREEEEKRAQETQRKLVKASSIKVKSHEVIHPEPAIIRQPVNEPEERPAFKASQVVNEMSQADLEAAEEARLMRGLMRATPGAKK
jgi:DNA repair exonuclease SbcCD ATPase subunit